MQVTRAVAVETAVFYEAILHRKCRTVSLVFLHARSARVNVLYRRRSVILA